MKKILLMLSLIFILTSCGQTKYLKMVTSPPAPYRMGALENTADVYREYSLSVKKNLEYEAWINLQGFEFLEIE